MRRPTLNSPRNNRTAHGSDPSTATCLLFSRLLSSTPKSKLSKQQQQQWRTTRRPKNHRRRRRRRWGASRTTPSAPSRPSSTSPASSPTPSSPSFSTMYSSPDCLLFFFFCVCLCDLVVLMRLVLAGGCRFTRRQRPSGSRSRTGGCRTGVRVTLFSEVWSLAWKSPFFSPFLLLCNGQGFEFLTEFDLLVSAGGVVHEKGLLPQACEYIAIKACKF